MWQLTRNSMKKDFKLTFGILIANIALLSVALIFITIKKLEAKPQTKTAAKPDSQLIIDPKLNHRIVKWKLIGQLDNDDIDYDFRNGLGGNLSNLPSGTLIDGESVWMYSKKLRQISIDTARKNRTYRENDPKLKGYIAVINRVSGTKLATDELWKIFDKKIGLYHFNLVDTEQLDLSQDDEAKEIFNKSKQDIEQFFQSLKPDPTL